MNIYVYKDVQVQITQKETHLYNNNVNVTAAYDTSERERRKKTKEDERERVVFTKHFLLELSIVFSCICYRGCPKFSWLGSSHKLSNAGSNCSQRMMLADYIMIMIYRIQYISVYVKSQCITIAIMQNLTCS